MTQIKFWQLGRNYMESFPEAVEKEATIFRSRSPVMKTARGAR